MLWCLVLPITLLVVWALLISWNMLAFTVFSVFVIPFRLHRRAQRRDLEAQRLQLETLQQLAQNAK